MHQLQALAPGLLYHHIDDDPLRILVLGHEHHACAVVPFLGDGNALKQNKLVGNLHQYSSAVARLVARLGSAVFHVLQHPQGIVNQLVALCTMYVHHHAYATRIMLIFRTI